MEKQLARKVHNYKNIWNLFTIQNKQWQYNITNKKNKKT